MLSYEEAYIVFEERGTNIIVTADNKNVKVDYKDALVNEPKEEKDNHFVTSQIGNREYFIKVGHADKLLKEIGIITQDGKVKNDMIRKYNQIDHFIELIDGMLKNLSMLKHITVLDCGCGKSYLSFVMNYYLKDVLKKSCSFIGIDYSEQVIQASKKRANNLGYSNMEFFRADLKEYVPDKKVDIVISLHACDIATDLALAAGVACKAKAIIAVPCCQKELLKQYKVQGLETILKHGVLKARMADVLTDGVRSLLLEAFGYKVSVVEYISPLETPKNLLIRAERVKEQFDENIFNEYKKIRKLLNISPTLEDRLIWGNQLI